MSNAGPTPTIYEPIRDLLRAGKNDEAIVILCAMVVTRPEDFVAKELLFDAFFQKRDWLPAFALVDELARRQPDNARWQKQLIVTLSNMKRYAEAIARASPRLEQHGEDLTILDVLKVAHFYTGKVDAAIRFGQRGIELRDAEACRLPRTVVMNNLIEPSGCGGRASTSTWRAGRCVRWNGADARARAVPAERRRCARSGVFWCANAMRNSAPDAMRGSRHRPIVRDHALHNELDDRLPVGRTHRLRHRHRRADAALFRRHPDGAIRPRPVHARPPVMAADPQPLPGARQVLPAARRPHRRAHRSAKPFRRRPPEHHGRVRQNSSVSASRASCNRARARSSKGKSPSAQMDETVQMRLQVVRVHAWRARCCRDGRD